MVQSRTMYLASRNAKHHPTFGVYVFFWAVAVATGFGGYLLYEYISHL
jgi:hypothetical protein